MGALTPFRLTKSATEVCDATTAELIVKLGETVAPSATVTEGGGDPMVGLDEERLKTKPPGGAG